MGYSDFSESNLFNHFWRTRPDSTRAHSDVIVTRSSDVGVVDRASQQGHERVPVPGLLPLLQEEGMDDIKSRTK